MLQKLEYKREANLIGGEWVGADNGATIDVNDPATGETIGSVPNCGTAETRRAIEAAEAAQPGWAAKTAAERAEILHRLAALIRENQEELAMLLTFEQGKPLAEARGEVGMGAAYIQWFAEEARRIYGDIIPSPWAGRQLLVQKQPVGVVAAITPWNFPAAMIARKLGPALAVGCTVVVKPASQTPYSGLAWGVLCEKAGVPAGVVNVVTGSAREIGAEICANPLVRKVSFTGSTEVGKVLVEQGAATMKRMSMELGGNAPFLVFDDADVDAAVEGAMLAKYRNSGQTCVCTNRFYVQTGIYEAFAEKLTDAVKRLKVGDGRQDGVQQGPLIDERAVDKVQQHIDDAVKKGGTVLAGGKRHALGGTFYEPTVIRDASQDMTVAQEETFGPLSPIFRFETEEEAIARANDTDFGLACYFYTRDLARVFRVSQGLKYGLVGVNAGFLTSEVAPFGGVKESGMGREGSKYGCDDYLDIKYVCVAGLD